MTRTKLFYVTPDGNELEIPFEFIEGSEMYKKVGQVHVLGVLCYEVDAENPLTAFDCVTKNSSEYKAWIRGDVYGICVWVWKDGELDRENECWGYYGATYAAKELKEQFKAICEQVKV
jgi:hypothetical protein